MQVDYNILISYGGVTQKYEKGAVIFHKDTRAYFFYQVLEGSVRIFSANNDGKELVQGMFVAGQSFGEPPLLLNKPYPSTAQAATPCILVKISRDKLLNLLQDCPDVLQGLLYIFAERIYQKSCAAQVWVSQSPEEKILQFLHNTVGPKTASAGMRPVSYTRQQIADFTGLRVETVIRTMLRMSEQKKIKIIDHKIYL
jgi:CRP/FNR family transcriptional regulator